MKKCVKITLTGVRHPQALYDRLKKETHTSELEGVVELPESDTIDIVVFGLKDPVDFFVNEIDGIVLAYNFEKGERVQFAVEPFYKTEDYRGVIRFVKKPILRRV